LTLVDMTEQYMIENVNLSHRKYSIVIERNMRNDQILRAEIMTRDDWGNHRNVIFTHGHWIEIPTNAKTFNGK
jgi:hypothetical protein